MRGALDTMLQKKIKLGMRHWEIQGDLVKTYRVTISAVYSLEASVQAHAHYAEEWTVPL